MFYGERSSEVVRPWPHALKHHLAVQQKLVPDLEGGHEHGDIEQPGEGLETAPEHRRAPRMALDALDDALDTRAVVCNEVAEVLVRLRPRDLVAAPCEVGYY